METNKDEVQSPEASEDTQDIKTEDIKAEEQNEPGLDENSLTSETDDTKPPEETLSRNLAASSSFALDELMDIGTVDQEEQEAQIKEEDENAMNTNVSQSPDLSNTESSSPATLVNGTKEKPAPSARSESSSPALVQVKDEPLDEEYDQALASTAAVKDEEDPVKNDLQIGAVFSVPSEKPAQPMPPHMSCFRCNKALVKGQTAYQRKGSNNVYCSTGCLTANMPQKKTAGSKVCHHCHKLIYRPQDVVLWPDVSGAVKDFCSQQCLSSFKKKITGGGETLCSMCSQFTVSKHEVTLNGICHKLCSDDCFNKFRMSNKLSMSGCAQCGSYFSSKPLLLILHDGNKTLCNQACLKKYKEKNPVTSTCTMCRSARTVSEMVENANPDDSVNLFCSTSCIMAYKVQTVSTSGVRLSCDTCSKISVPSYHLAMSDTSIRNFCTLPCVLAFQEKFKKSPSLSNVFTKVPAGPPQLAPLAPQPPVAVSISHVPRSLTCRQCDVKIQMKPDVLQIENKLLFFCTQNCVMEFKTVNGLVNVCEYCKVEKVTKEVKRIASRDCHFCSDGCKLLHRHDLTKAWGTHCQSCSFCHSGAKKVVTAHYGSSAEEFCSDDCRSKYTMLFCHVAKCDFCARKGKLKQSLSLLGDAKHFCDLSCLLRFCTKVTETQGPLNLKIRTPVIANVMSLASPEPSPVSAPDVKSTRAAKNVNTKPIYPPPPSTTKLLKNKALLCKPLVQNKGISCKTQTVDCEIQTDKPKPDVLILPVPVPVYVPVPMAMYSQCTPQALGLPFPLPVPMFLPVAMNNAEKIVQTIQEIKQKIPSDPFEAELILMAEMVAEDTEEKPKEKPPEKQASRGDAPQQDDRGSTYSDDLDTDDLTSFLNNWEDTDSGLRTPSRPFATEKLAPLMDIPVGTPPTVPFSEPRVLSPPPMDLESDQTIETLERWAQMREEAAARGSSPPPARLPRKAREKKKRGRKAKNAPPSPEPETPLQSPRPVPDLTQRLKSEYGLDAWKRWVQWRRNQTDVHKLTIGSRPVDLKEDILRCTTAELSLGLCFFISEIKRPNGEPYSPDSLYYLCLGIQQHLFNNGRVENIFMDRFYCRFSSDFTKMLGGFKPVVTSSGYIHSRVEEEFLWECKQLGAYSPIVLLNTLLFFCCKHFGFRTVEQHRQLSFAHVMRCTKTDPNNKKTTFLRFYPPVAAPVAPVNQTDEPAAKKRRGEELQDEVLEMTENVENPLRCPVRLYEFYLSKCSESVKQRTNLFYLHPERCCVPNSPLWFSSTPLDDTTMDAMLIRILSTRELHPRISGGGDDNNGTGPDDDQLYVPEEEDDDSD